MFNPFDDDEAAKFVRKLTGGKSITPVTSTLNKALRKAEKSWLDHLPLCNQALAAAAVVAAARGRAGTIPVPDEVTAWIDKCRYAPDDHHAEQAARVVELVRTNSALQEIADDVGWREWKSGCTQLTKRLRQEAKPAARPLVKAKPPAKTKPAPAMTPSAARKTLQKKRGDFETVKGGLRFTCWAENALTDEDLQVLACIPDVREVALEGQAITDAGLQHLGSLQKLDTLDLRKVNIGPAGLEHLLSLKKLRTLRLRACATDEMLKVVCRMQNLRVLDLFNSKQVTDKGLRCLKELKQLKELNILRTGITPAVAGKIGQALKQTDVKADP